jgi:ABC-type transport system involved in multi-copper enzyme maturation permease subunit
MKNLLILLTVLFIGLKLGSVITWPWLYVLAPLILWTAFVISVGVAVAILTFREEMEAQKAGERIDKIISDLLKK